MAYALVSAGAVTSGASPITPSFGATPTAGSLLVCWVAIDAFGNVPSTPSGWSVPRANFTAVKIFYKIAVGGDTAPTLTSAGTTMHATLAEFSGNLSASPDNGNALAQGGSGSASPQSLSLSGNDAEAGALLIGVQATVASKAGTTTSSIAFTDSGGASPTSQDSGNNDATSTAQHYRFAYAISTSGGVTQAGAGTFTDKSMNLTGITVSIASFRPAAVAAGRVPRSRQYSQLISQ